MQLRSTLKLFSRELDPPEFFSLALSGQIIIESCRFELLCEYHFNENMTRVNEFLDDSLLGSMLDKCRDIAKIWGTSLMLPLIFNTNNRHQNRAP